MKSLDTISIGGATYDLFVRTPHEIIRTHEGKEAFTLPLGAKVPVNEVLETCGGGASNTSVGLARLGLKAGFCGVIADDQWGGKLLRNLKENDVETSCATVVEGEVSSFSIILSASSGERVILYSPGTNEHLHDVTFDRETVGKARWVYLNHIQAQSCVIQDDLAAIFTQEGCPGLTWNPGGCQIDEGLHAKNNRALLGSTDLLLLNKHEAQKFTKEEKTEEAMRILRKAGAERIFVTDGGNGTWAMDEKAIYHCPVAPANVIDTTGAGDAFGTGATWALFRGMDLPDILRAGTINAASVVSVIGAQAGLLTDTEMRRRLETLTLDVAVTPL